MGGKPKGFTLIEVVLVLAIGGLIFLLAFLAFGQASKNRRDTQRRQDIERVFAALNTYRADNAGLLPVGASPTEAFEAAYFGSDFKDPSNQPYDIRWASGRPANLQQIRYAAGYVCDVSNDKLVPTTEHGGPSNNRGIFAVVGELESGGFHCVDNT